MIPKLIPRDWDDDNDTSVAGPSSVQRNGDRDGDVSMMESNACELPSTFDVLQ
jgi:hypothetical protein